MVATVLLDHNPAGNTAGTAVTQANSGGSGGDDFSRLLAGDIGAGTAITYVNDGGICYHLTQSAAGILAFYDTWVGAQSVYSELFEIELDNTPSLTCGMIQLFSDDAYGAGAVVQNVQVTAGSPAGRLRVRNQVTSLDFTATTGLTPGVRYVCQYLYQASSNTVTLNVYVKGSATVVAGAGTTASIPTATSINSRRMGILTASTGFGYELARNIIGHSDFITRYDIAAASPVINQGAQARRTYQSGTAISMPTTATITGDTIATMTLAWTTKPTGASDPTLGGGSPTGLGTASAAWTPTATLGSIGTYVATITVTPTTGGAPAATTTNWTFEVYPVPDTRTIIRQMSVTSNYAVIGGPANTNAGAAIAMNDNDATTGIESIATNPTGITGSAQFGPVGPTGLVLRASADVTGGGTLTRVWKVYKEDHTTQIYTVTESGITAATTSVALPLDATALAAVPLASPNDLGRAALWVDWTDTVV